MLAPAFRNSSREKAKRLNDAVSLHKRKLPEVLAGRAQNPGTSTVARFVEQYRHRIRLCSELSVAMRTQIGWRVPVSCHSLPVPKGSPHEYQDRFTRLGRCRFPGFAKDGHSGGRRHHEKLRGDLERHGARGQGHDDPQGVLVVLHGGRPEADNCSPS